MLTVRHGLWKDKPSGESQTEVDALQDWLTHVRRELAEAAIAVRGHLELPPTLGKFACEALFATLTNVNQRRSL